jgi:beta-carotene/zeaxanthin 4-ketolase
VTRSAPRLRQHIVGIGLAAAVIGAWLAVHVFGIFFWQADLHGWAVAAPMVLVQTWLSTGLFIVAHDAMHGALAPGQPAWNRRVGTLCLMLYAGLSYRQLLPKHAAHHRHAGSAEDPDFHAADPRRLLPWFGRFFATYYTHGQFLRITAAVVVYVFLLGASYLNILLFWAVPAVLALVQLFVFGTYLPHRHEDEPFADRHRARSAGFSDPLSLVTCFHFGGYHHEHHLSPGTPWWRLPAFRRERRGESARS